MNSMYETIMDLPLFKGIGEDQLSQMLEKTKMEFLKFEDGEVICRMDENVESLNFILNGRVKLTYRMNNFPIEIDEIRNKNSVIGALHLFGMNTSYNSVSTAIGKVSIMRIGKSQYMNILKSDSIYMLNFLNYLSAAAQKTPDFLMDSKGYSIGRTLETLAFSIVSKRSETVMVAGEDQVLADYCGVTLQEFEEWKISELAHNRVIVNQRGIFLKSPHLLR